MCTVFNIKFIEEIVNDIDPNDNVHFNVILLCIHVHLCAACCGQPVNNKFDYIIYLTEVVIIISIYNIISSNIKSVTKKDIYSNGIHNIIYLQSVILLFIIIPFTVIILLYHIIYYNNQIQAKAKTWLPLWWYMFDL